MADDDLNASSNPQPPPLTAEEKEILEFDNIGDTAYSKKWVLAVLLHFIRDFKEENSKNVKGSANSDKSNPNNEIGMDPVLEEKLCELWDMTMDSDVSRYMHSEGAIDLMLEFILNTASLRKLEICLGILANMACTPDVCKAIVEHSKLSDVTLFHIDNPDVRTLTELNREVFNNSQSMTTSMIYEDALTIRLIGVCLSNKESRAHWIEALKKHSIMEKLLFILENSLNVELLDGVADVFDKLIDFDDLILNEHSTQKTVTIICDVYRRIAVKHPQSVQTILHILQLISTTEKGVSALAAVKDSGEIARIILVAGSQYFTPLQSNFPSLVSSCCILNVLMTAEDNKTNLFGKKDFKILSTVLSLTEELSERTSEGSSSRKDDSKENGSVVYTNYFSAVTDFLFLLVEIFLATPITEKAISKLKERKAQIARVVSILRELPDCNPMIDKLVLSLQENDILEIEDNSIQNDVIGKEGNETNQSKDNDSSESEESGTDTPG